MLRSLFILFACLLIVAVAQKGKGGGSNDKESTCKELSQMRCRASTSCSWVGGLCLRNDCATLNTSVDCVDEQCRWLSSGTCVDPRTAELSCGSMTTEAVCALRPTECRWSEESCREVSSPQTTAPRNANSSIDVKLPCSLIPVRTGCSFAKDCEWSMGSCRSRSCESFENVQECPSDRCTWKEDDKECAARCPSEAPVFCSVTQLCAKSLLECRSCASSEVQCWDSSCAEDLSKCPCPPSSPTRCDDHRCAANKDACTATPSCSGNTSVRCWNSKCAQSETECECPPSLSVRCTNKDVCVRSQRDCNKQACSEDAPILCWDNSCVEKKSACPCPMSAAFRCPDNSCVQNRTQCPCSEGLLQCPESPRCVTSLAQCSESCTFTCPDRTCAESAKNCSCDVTTQSKIMLSLDVSDTVLDITKVIRIQATMTLLQCGQPVEESFPVQWAIDSPDLDSETIERLTKRRGSTLVIPPNFLPEDIPMIIEAKVTTRHAEASASVSILTFSPSPTVEIFGGDRLVSAQGNLQLVGKVDDPLQKGKIDDVQWTCCIPNAASFKKGETVTASVCGMECPEPLKDLPKGRHLQIKSKGNSLLPTGTFVFGCMYKSQISYTWVEISHRSEDSIVDVQIYPLRRTVFTDTELHLLSAFDLEDENVAIQWYAGVKPLSGATKRNLVLKPENLRSLLSSKFAEVSEKDAVVTQEFVINVTASSGIFGTASVIVSFRQPPSGGRLIVEIEEEEEGGPGRGPPSKIIAATTNIKLRTSGWNVSSADALKVTFRFGYMEGEKFVPLSTGFQSSQTLSVRAPLVEGNPKSSRVTFVAQMSLDGEDVIAQAELDVTISGSDEDVDELGKKAAKVLKQAAHAKDKSSFMRNLPTVTAALGGNNNTKAKRGVAATLLGALAETFASNAEQGEDMTSTERGAAAEALAAIVRTERKQNHSRQSGNKPNPDEKEEEEELERNITKVLKALLTRGKGNNPVNVKNHGQAIAEVAQHVKNVTARKELFRQLSNEAAFGVSMGERVLISTENATVFAEKRPAVALDDAPVHAGNSTLHFPRRFAMKALNATDATEVAISATEYRENLVGKGGLKKEERLAGDVTEIELQRDGTSASVRNLTEPIRLTLKMRLQSEDDLQNNFSCKYFDEAKGWTADGVTTDFVDRINKVVHCNTTHLSIFSLATMSRSAPSTFAVSPLRITVLSGFMAGASSSVSFLSLALPSPPEVLL